MTVFISKSGDLIEIKALAAGDGVIGDLTRVIKPGETVLGKAYEEWAALPPGKHEITLLP